MDDIAEQQDLANEISAAISSPMGFGNDVDEDELLAELEGMEQEEMDRQVSTEILCGTVFAYLWTSEFLGRCRELLVVDQ